ncbi:MAG: hypothetical protein J6V99_03270 [Neisseriaceae bacterium]|nr:hypothetical protein [Neisseriaceae bacterium]
MATLSKWFFANKTIQAKFWNAKKYFLFFVFFMSCTWLWADEMKIKMTVNHQTFTATLYNNAAAQHLWTMLPLNLPMTELNGNEKYHQFRGQSFPTQSSIIQDIHRGDLMIFSHHYLVVFYKDFHQSAYAYTPIGKIDHPQNLAHALGKGNVNIRIEKQ